MLTLAHYPTAEEHVAMALNRLGRPSDHENIVDVARRLSAAECDPDVADAASVEDTSVGAHRHHHELLVRRADIDPHLAEALYALLGSQGLHPIYPDARHVLATLHGGGCRIGVVSDIHVDLRVHARRFEVDSFVDEWTLSFEIGAQKPDRRIFEHALDRLHADPARTLMVGDRATHDGAAVALGVTCLILPALTQFGP